ncbi:MAG: adenylate/guanylate cyclase domain-containing protein [Deltaproteobacteria bacterium]|nr:adenylate/guanylate cyclase domain-containing protein [Candidatus Anaeroferrophillus wilburensis]MBN2888474.1 adenylate/guanylate cyclase domain-containing protein [Deltaproteobacteria bacterium]
MEEINALITTQYSWLHRQFEKKIGELSAICEMLDLVAIDFETGQQQLLAKILEVIHRHTGVDALIYQHHQGGEKSAPFRIFFGAPGIKDLNSTETEQLNRMIDEATAGAILRPVPFAGRALTFLPLTTAEQSFGQLIVLHHDQTFFSADLFRFLNLLTKELASLLLLLDKQRQLLEETRKRERLNRFFSPEIGREILAAGHHLPKGRKVTATILFADIRGFSRLTEQHEAYQVVEMLNSFYATMTKIIFAHQGTLDKFTGDGILALFGTPVSRSDDPQRAIRAAVAMQQQWQQQRTMMTGTNQQQLEQASFAIGIHTGEVVAGFLGNEELLTYTVVGDPVNTCQRIVSLAEAAQIIISQQTLQAAGFTPEHHPFERYHPSRPLKGMDKSITLFRLDWQEK